MLNRFTGYKRLLALAALNGGASIIERTATGNPLTFLTDLASPLKSLIIPFTPVQSGTGDPSPENIRPILPWDGLTVWHGGKNLLDIAHTTFKKWRLDSNVFKVVTDDSQWIDFNVNGDDLKVTANKAYFGVGFSVEAFESARVVSVSSAIGGVAFYSDYEDGATRLATGSMSCVIPANTSGFLGLRFDSIGEKTITVQLEVGSTASSHEEYKPITETDISIPSPVYGGTLDVVSGVLTVEYGIITKNTADMNNEADYPGWKNSGVRALIGEGLSGERDGVLNIGTKFSINTKNNNDVLFLSKGTYNKTQDEWIALAIDVQIAIPLATPQIIQLTPEQISTLIGNNTVWSDANGSMTAVYLISESFAEDHPISGGLGSGLLGGGFGSGSGEPDEPAEPDEPGNDQPADDQPEEP